MNKRGRGLSGDGSMVGGGRDSLSGKGGVVRIQIILFWIYKYGTISVTIIYINKHDSRINPGNRYKDICRGTSVTIRLPGQ